MGIRSSEERKERKLRRQEKKLLKKLNDGELDGFVGDDFYPEGGSRVYTLIKKGKIKRYQRKADRKYFDGKENVRIPGKLLELESWDTDEEKIGFFQKFGWLMKDEDAQDYSSNFKGMFKKKK